MESVNQNDYEKQNILSSIKDPLLSQDNIARLILAEKFDLLLKQIQKRQFVLSMNFFQTMVELGFSEQIDGFVASEGVYFSHEELNIGKFLYTLKSDSGKDPQTAYEFFKQICPQLLKYLDSKLLEQNQEWEILYQTHEWDILARNGQIDYLVKGIPSTGAERELYKLGHFQTLIDHKCFYIFSFFADGDLRLIEAGYPEKVSSDNFVNLLPDIYEKQGAEWLFQRRKRMLSNLASNVEDFLLQKGRTEMFVQQKLWYELAEHKYYDLIDWEDYYHSEDQNESKYQRNTRRKYVLKLAFKAKNKAFLKKHGCYFRCFLLWLNKGKN